MNTVIPRTFTPVNTRSLKKLGICLTALVVTVSDAIAFVPEHHSEFAIASAKIYLKYCASTKLPEATQKALIKALAHGTFAEDAPTTVERILNWHFYNRENSVLSLGFIERNLDRIFDKRVEGLKKISAESNSVVAVFEAAGRALHYIQDMSVPAHVVPIYHDPLQSDKFESYKPSDPNLLSKVLTEIDLNAANGCDAFRPRSPIDTFGKLLEASADATLKAIGQSPTSDQSSLSWHKFWTADRDLGLIFSSGFAKYGPCKFSAKAKQECVIDTRDLDAIYASQYRRVIEDGIRFLLIVESTKETLNKSPMVSTTHNARAL